MSNGLISLGCSTARCGGHSDQSFRNQAKVACSTGLALNFEREMLAAELRASKSV